MKTLTVIGKIQDNNILTVNAPNCPLTGCYCVVGSTKDPRDKPKYCCHLDVPDPGDIDVLPVTVGTGLTHIYCYYPDKPPNPSIIEMLKFIVKGGGKNHDTPNSDPR